MNQTIRQGAEQTQPDHKLSLAARRELTVSAVQEVLRLEEDQVVLKTAQGLLVIRGRDLSLVQMAPKGDLTVLRGQIQSLSYETAVTGGFFKRLFG